ncbi:hypothetical protein ACR720_06015 [Sphingomonas parapaucimobilis]|jgi:hypothetical protein|uniref:hypothetical protein n=1 Tax=Sphingomonas parapaucimobilis TaxID=28213 RepID=UPI0039E82D70
MSILSRTPLALPLLAALALSACDRPNQGTSITVNGSDGETLASVDGKSGEVKLALPGFSGAFKLPKVSMEADNFELNGVHLYPGSTIRNVDVGNGRDKAFTMTFDSPADPATVRSWFRDKMGEADFTLTDQGGALVGKTAEEKSFRLDLRPLGGDRSTGTITLGG